MSFLICSRIVLETGIDIAGLALLAKLTTKHYGTSLGKIPMLKIVQNFRNHPLVAW